jgi:hypothetical protein
MTGSELNSILLQKREFVYFCGAGTLRVLASRVVGAEQPRERVFSVGVSSSPIDVSNCVVVQLRPPKGADRYHADAIRKDLMVISAEQIASISPVKLIDAQPLRDLVDDHFKELFVDTCEPEWKIWMRRESIDLHLGSFRRLLEWSGQKPLLKSESKSQRLKNLVEVASGGESGSTINSDDVSMKFLANLHYLAERLGSEVGQVTTPFEVMSRWGEINNVSKEHGFQGRAEKLQRKLKKLESVALTYENLEEKKLLAKIRKQAQNHKEIYSKEVQPLVMSFILDANYRIIGDVFSVADFVAALGAIRRVEKDRAAWLYTLFIACRLETEVIYTHTTTHTFQ